MLLELIGCRVTVRPRPVILTLGKSSQGLQRNFGARPHHLFWLMWVKVSARVRFIIKPGLLHGE